LPTEIITLGWSSLSQNAGKATTLDGITTKMEVG